MQLLHSMNIQLCSEAFFKYIHADLYNKASKKYNV